MNSSHLSFAALAAGLMALASPAHAQIYTAQDLGNWRPFALNASGQLTGEADDAGVMRAFITDIGSGQLTHLSTPGGLGSYGTAINAAGQVAGNFYTNTSFGVRAFVTGPNGSGFVDLGSFGSGASQATGINNAGQVIGYSYTTEGSTRAFITEADGVTLRELGTLGGKHSLAHAINDAGQVAGRSWNASDSMRAFITGPNGMGMTDLGTLGMESDASGINASGQVVGYYTKYDQSHNPRSFAFITGPNGLGMRDLGTLGGDWSQASAVNAAGQVVGYSLTADRQAYHAFMTGPNGEGMVDVNSRVPHQGFEFTGAAGINDAGQFLAYGSNSHVYLVTPAVPEPAACALVLAGLGMMGAMARRARVKGAGSMHLGQNG